MANHRVVGLACLLCLGTLLSACSIRGATLEIPGSTFEIPLFLTANQRVYPWRVGVVSDKEFAPYKITFKDTNTTNTWALSGLPDAFAKTLSPHFVAVDMLETDPNPSMAAYDLIARMSVEKLTFERVMGVGQRGTVDLAMHFSLERTDGTEVFERTITQSYSTRYRNEFVAPGRTTGSTAAFDVAFEAVFRQLAALLAASDLKLDAGEVRVLPDEPPRTAERLQPRALFQKRLS